LKNKPLAVPMLKPKDDEVEMEDTLSNFNKYKNLRKEWIKEKIKVKSKIASRVVL
tara:strand:+ start:187 stop:351 length:165 start_codon:yes stop_codon:yes gene_type:complete